MGAWFVANCVFIGVKGVLAPGASDPSIAFLRGSSGGVGRVIGQERRSSVAKLVTAASQREVPVNARSEAVLHIIDHNPTAHGPERA